MNGIKCVERCIVIFLIGILILQPGYAIAASTENKKVVAVSPKEEDQTDFNALPKPKASPAGPTGYQKVVNIVEG
ncbi:hypothetical protein HUB98_12120 [Paenibacillus barcinonensis]|uniref:Uncharacterized protein n=2 Tax=Paenibacillus TaxID=44249 RepID=A0A2V4UPS2_PAEBA|nr:hypothetical protein [Paenibacillus barcinonensis]PYE42113.1 hypothetical protein DFQ00_1436 [Paenibacillus barcinonensis]QKS57000.1 hypothetical protein HUB98_12120 [Paenibacillus barcinonensis]